MTMIRRLESLANEADETLAKGGSKFSEIFGGKSQQAVNSRLEGIFSETIGILVNLKSEFKSYGLSIKNESIADMFDNPKDYRSLARSLRSAIGFLKAKTSQL